jgi:phage terminase large subunit
MASAALRIDYEFPEKFGGLFERGKYRYKVYYGGRDGAKSWSLARALLLMGAESPLRVGCFREVQDSIADSVHKLLKDQVEALGLSHFYEVLKTEIRGKNGTEFLFSGLSNETKDSLKSFEGIDIAWVEEAHTISEGSWETLDPTIRKKGSEIWVSFNPDLDTDFIYAKFIDNAPDEALVVNVNWTDNPWRSEALDNARKHMERTEPEKYAHVYMGKPNSAAAGAIYSNEMEKLGARVTNIPYDPMMKVHTIWDLGWNDQTSIIFVQRNLSEVRIIDYYEENHLSMAEHVSALNAKGYNYGTDWIPWDGAEERYRLTDPKNSPEGILRKLQRKVAIVDKLDVESGIKKARLVFPRCYFDKAKTVRLRECLKRYCRAIPRSTEEPAKPLHDEYSHGADAFRYLAVAVDRMKNDEPHQKRIVYPQLGVV